MASATFISVSPTNPKAKKRKTENPPHSVLASVFQTTKAPALGPKAQEYQNKPEDQKQPFEYTKSAIKVNNVKQEDKDSMVLEQRQHADLAVRAYMSSTVSLWKSKLSLESIDVVVLRYTKTWKPRARVRVLAHCKRCLQQTPAKRALAASASTETSPGALVAASSTAVVASERLTPPPKPANNLPHNDSSFFGYVAK
ncbi:hypothetical protein GALMADRAFT_217518 [Galerina marginata CBS 339.88]|uniref:Uncharacterized protein n=1 Tax=Galerina marginata (strain CBS 339.88) TaxID=685588 RepID=A0A067S413_GALM3|nr:hypothetical protein GALMADRAFT_217518 [Galerina marginata CBS 339.88]